jgi:hypothetical protein
MASARSALHSSSLDCHAPPHPRLGYIQESSRSDHDSTRNGTGAAKTGGESISVVTLMAPHYGRKFGLLVVRALMSS